MVTVQSVLSWFGGTLSYEEEKSSEAVSEEKSSAQSNAESNEEEKLESVSPASDIFPKLNGNSMEINGYTVPPSNDKNGALAVLKPVMEDLQEYLRKHHIWLELKTHKLCNNTGRNNWRCKRVREGDFKYCAKCRKSV